MVNKKGRLLVLFDDFERRLVIKRNTENGKHERQGQKGFICRGSTLA